MIRGMGWLSVSILSVLGRVAGVYAGESLADGSLVSPSREAANLLLSRLCRALEALLAQSGERHGRTQAVHAETKRLRRSRSCENVSIEAFSSEDAEIFLHSIDGLRDDSSPNIAEFGELLLSGFCQEADGGGQAVVDRMDYREYEELMRDLAGTRLYACSACSGSLVPARLARLRNMRTNSQKLASMALSPDNSEESADADPEEGANPVAEILSRTNARVSDAVKRLFRKQAGLIDSQSVPLDFFGMSQDNWAEELASIACDFRTECSDILNCFNKQAGREYDALLAYPPEQLRVLADLGHVLRSRIFSRRVLHAASGPVDRPAQQRVRLQEPYKSILRRYRETVRRYRRREAFLMGTPLDPAGGDSEEYQWGMRMLYRGLLGEWQDIIGEGVGELRDYFVRGSVPRRDRPRPAY